MSRRRFVGRLALLASLLAPAVPAQEERRAPLPAPAASVDPAQTIGRPAGSPLSGDRLDQAQAAIERLLRCPVCQGLSIEDSTTPSAIAMRLEVRALLERGYSSEQILSYFVSTYGEFILLDPRARGLNWLVWLFPLALLLLGALLIARRTRRRAAPAAEEDELAPYLRRVREESGHGA